MRGTKGGNQVPAGAIERVQGGGEGLPSGIQKPGKHFRGGKVPRVKGKERNGKNRYVGACNLL